MIYCVCVGLALLAAVNFRIAKSPFYPPLVLCATWLAALLLILSVADFFYPISAKALLIYFTGAAAFSFGAALIYLLPKTPTSTEFRSPTQMLNSAVILALVGSLYVGRWALNLSGSASLSALTSIRMATVDQGNQFDTETSIAYSFVTFALILAAICYYENGRKRKVLAIALAIALIMLTGSKGPAISVILAIPVIDWLKYRQVRRKVLLAMTSVFILLFCAVAVLLNHGDVNREAPLADNLKPLASVFTVYAAGGLVAFDQVVREPQIIPHNWKLETPILLWLNRVGGHFTITPPNAEFVTIGPNALATNVYTIYFAYFDYGFTGIIALMTVVGALCCIVYREALSGNPLAILFSSFLVSACVLSVFSEYFFLALNFYSKLFLVAWSLYRMPVIWRRFLKFTSPLRL